jgi:hypothetical protein
MKTLVAAAALAASVLTASALYADNSDSSNAHDGAMMGSGMMGMMKMMGEMSGMMDHCNQMMQGTTGDGTGKPNEQWRRQAPAVPDQGN